MKKILSLLGAITLIGTTSTSVIACGGKEEDPKPIPPSQIQTDLSGLSDNVIISEVSNFIKEDFIIKLINVLKNQAGFEKLLKDDVNFTKSNGDILTDNDIINNDNLEIKISAKQTSRFFKGAKNITVKLTIAIQTDLDFLPNNLDIIDIKKNNFSDFKLGLINKLKTIIAFSKLWTNDIDIYKKGTSTLLNDTDIVNNDNLEIKISAKQTSRFFKGAKNITVKLTIAIQTDLDFLPNNLDIIDIKKNNFSDFKLGLINKLKTIIAFSKLWTNDIDIYKKGTSTLLNDTDIVNNDNLEIKISAKQTSRFFKGAKNITVKLTIAIQTELSALLDNAIVNNVIEHDVDNFIEQLINVLKNQVGFDKLSKSDFDITKSNHVVLTDNDIINNDNLEIKISAEQTSRFFKGTKNITVNLTTI